MARRDKSAEKRFAIRLTREMTSRARGTLLEENLDRVIESVVRNINAGRGAVPDLDAPADQPETTEPEESRATIADLCGHVAHALKTLDAGPHALASYKAAEPPATPPTLNLVR